MKKILPTSLILLLQALCLNMCVFAQSRTIPYDKHAIITIRFAHGDATVSARDSQNIRDAVRQSPDEVWTVDARTSSSGSTANNSVLSERRATAVADILARAGVRPDFINPIFRGETEADQTADNADDRVVYLTHRHRRSPTPEPEASPMTVESMRVNFRVVDALTGKTIAGKGSILPNGQAFAFGTTGASIDMDYRKTVTIHFTAEGYRDTTVTFATDKPPVVQMLPDYVAERLVFQNIYFFSNTPDIVPESFRALEEVYRQLSAKRTIAVKIQVRGHVNWPAPLPNTEATMQEHQLLSERRAKAVMDWLIKKGIPAETISSVGLGSSQMLFPHAVTEGEQAQNRRVEIILLNK